jgi:hypothetical protein
MEQISVSTWTEFMTLSMTLDGWAFRGQKDARWPLLTSLERYLTAYLPDRSSWRLREERAIRIFRRKAHNYLSDPTVLDNDLRCLALMQHHGAPTRGSVLRTGADHLRRRRLCPEYAAPVGIRPAHAAGHEP